MIYIISDIHGEYELFIKLLQKINFSRQDELICCGDMIDKGPNSVRLLQFIKSMPNVKCIMGNHELEFLKYYWGMTQEEVVDFDVVLAKIQAYFSDGYLLDWELVDWLEALPFYVERNNFICVHAGIPLDDSGAVMPLERVKLEQLVYDRRFKDPILVPITNKTVFFGHTPTSYISNESKIIAYRKEGVAINGINDYYKIHLDLGVWLHGVLGCFCIETCEEFYVSKY